VLFSTCPLNRPDQSNYARIAPSTVIVTKLVIDNLTGSCLLTIEQSPPIKGWHVFNCSAALSSANCVRR
jgi:hypothetical protein